MITTINPPQVNSFEQLIERAHQKASQKLPRTALVVPSAQSWLSAFDRAIREKLVDPVIIGDEALFHDHCAQYGLSLSGAKILDINQPDVAIMTAAQMAARGELDLIVKGRTSTLNFLHLVLSRESGFVPRKMTLSHIGLFKPSRYDRLLMVTDGGVVPQPDLSDKLALIANVASLAQAIGIGKPRVAVLAAVEAIYPQMLATTDAAVLAKMSDRGQIKGAYVDGPLSFDVAIDAEAAEAKGIVNSPVAGQTDAMIAPNIETANGVFKAMALYGQADIAGVMIGGRVPVALGNRWDSPVTKYNSIALGVLAS